MRRVFIVCWVNFTINVNKLLIKLCKIFNDCAFCLLMAQQQIWVEKKDLRVLTIKKRSKHDGQSEHYR